MDKTIGVKFIPIEKDNIPSIPLYMDQVTSYLERELSAFKVAPEDKVLTKTMINNYVKAGVLDKPVKKKYDRSRIMALIMIYQLKNILPLADVMILFEQITDEEMGSADTKSIEKVYDLYVSLQKKVKEELSREITQKKNIDTSAMLEMGLKADLYKRMLQQSIADSNEENKKST